MTLWAPFAVQSDLASSLGLSLGTVKSRMFTGLARMREFLAAASDPPTVSHPSREFFAAQLDG